MCLAPDRPKSDYTEIPKVEKSSCRVIYSRARRSEQAIDPAKDALQGVEPTTNAVRATLRAVTRGPVLGLLQALGPPRSNRALTLFRARRACPLRTRSCRTSHIEQRSMSSPRAPTRTTSQSTHPPI